MELKLSVVPPHWADYLVLGVFLVICMGIGIYHGYKMDKQKTLENYLLGNRQMQYLPVSISLFVTFASAISLMGVPTEMYAYGTMAMYLFLGHAVSVLFGGVTIVPLLYPLKLTSTYEYLERRFDSKAVRMVGVLLGMLQTITYMGVTLYTPALALQTVAGMPLWLSIVGIGGVGTIYTCVGGIKSVVWTDVFQCVMVFVGMFAVIIKGWLLIGDADTIIRIAQEGKRLQFDDISVDPRVRHTVWGCVIGVFFTWLPNWCNQSTIQRVSSLKSLKAAQTAFMLNVPVVVFYCFLTAIPGILMYVYYNTLQCDPLESGVLTSMNQLTPFFVFDILRTLPGMSGVFVSTLFSGSLSTLSSGINALAANTVEDLMSGYLRTTRRISPTAVAKIAVMIYGAAIVFIAYMMRSIKGPVTQMALSFFGACGGPIAGLFFLGGMFPNTNWIGALVGSIVAVVFNMWIGVGSLLKGKKTPPLAPNPIQGCFINETMSFGNYSAMTAGLPDTLTTSFMDSTTMSIENEGENMWLYDLSYTWYGMTGVLITLIVGLLVSCCTGFDRGYPVDSDYIIPCCRRFWGMDVDKEKLVRAYRGTLLPRKVVQYEHVKSKPGYSPTSTLDKTIYADLSDDNF